MILSVALIVLSFAHLSTSILGWLSFSDVVDSNNVVMIRDTDLPERVKMEIACAKVCSHNCNIYCSRVLLGAAHLYSYIASGVSTSHGAFKHSQLDDELIQDLLE